MVTPETSQKRGINLCFELYKVAHPKWKAAREKKKFRDVEIECCLPEFFKTKSLLHVLTRTSQVRTDKLANLKDVLPYPATLVMFLLNKHVPTVGYPTAKGLCSHLFKMSSISSALMLH